MLRNLFSALVVVLVAAGCGGGGDQPESSARGDTAGATAPASSVPPPSAAPAAQHFDSDFGQVCRGTGVPWATAYDAGQKGLHKVVVLQGAGESDLTATATSNAEWDVTFDAASDAYAAVELVACAIRSGEKLAQTCSGYKDNGVDTGKTVDYYSATYSVTLRAATTAAVIAETTVEAPGDECPMLVFFDKDQKTATEYADVDVNDFLLEYATT